MIRSLLLPVVVFICLPLSGMAGDSGPQAEFSVPEPSRTGCPDFWVQFTSEATADPGDPIVYHEWDFGDGYTSTEESPFHGYTAEGEFTVKYIVETESGARDTVEKTSYITVTNSFHIDLGPDTVICSSASLLLDAETPGASDYLWSDYNMSPQTTVFYGGEYFVEVHKDGCIARDTIYVDMRPLLSASFDAMYTPGECAPTDVEFVDLSQSCNTTVVQWLWDFGDGETSTEQNPLHRYKAPGEYEVMLTVTDDIGSFTSALYPIYVDALPSPEVDMGADQAICEGAATTLDAGNPGADYLWSTGATTQTLAVNEAGEYVVAVTLDGCTTRDTIAITVNPAITVGFEAEQTSDCFPVQYTFTDLSQSCQGTVTSWHWDFGDGATSSEQHPQHAFQAVGYFTITLTVENSSGGTQTFTNVLEVFPDIISVDLGADTSICAASPIVLDAGNPGFDYTWSTGETTQQIMASSAGQYSVIVSRNGCEWRDTVNVQLLNAVTANFGHVVETQCLPIPVVFRDSSELSCDEAAASWLWNFGDGSTSTEQHPVHNYLSAGNFPVQLTVTSPTGSVSTVTRHVEVINTIHSVNLPEKMLVCRGTSVTLDAGVTGAQYSWSPATGVNDVHARRPVVTPEQNQLYTVSVTKCMVMIQGSVFLKQDTAVTPVITREGNTLKASAAAGYQWYLDGNLLPGMNSETLNADRKGNYTVRIYNEQGCQKTSEPAFFLPSKGNEGKNDLRAVLSPNPTTGTINLAISEIPARGARVTIRTTTGAPVMVTTVKENINVINAGNLAKGIYMLEVVAGTKRAVIPVIIQ